MNNELIQSFGLGVALGGLLLVWKKGSLRWGHWLPALRKTAELSLKVVIAITALYALWFALSEDGKIQERGLSLGAGLGLVALYLKFKLGLSLNRGEKIKRGTTIHSASEVKRQVFAKSKRHRLRFGDVPIPNDAEPYHFLIAGATGTGKSVAIGHVLQELRAANDTVIVVDSGGDFLSKHFVPETDFVFNPFDDRCVNWSPLLEMQGEWDAEALARSMIPDASGESKEWNSYAQTLVASVLRKLWSENRLSLQDLLYYVLSAPIPELKEFLQGTASAGQLASEKTFGSIRTIASNYLNPYSYLPGAGDGFSVGEMIQAEHSGFLFLTYRDDQLDSLRGLMACILDVASRAILSLPPASNRRVWLVIDEFASIGRVQSIEAVATKARKVGGCLLVGLQTTSQLKDRYGEHTAQTILSCLSTWLVLRCADADTAEYMSKYVGDVELIRQSKSTNVSETGDTRGQNEQQTTQRAVLPSQIQALPNLKGYLKIAGGFPLCEVELQTKSLKNTEAHTASFVKRDTRVKPLMKLTKAPNAEIVSAEPLPQVATAQPRAPQTPQAPQSERPRQPFPSSRSVEAQRPESSSAPSTAPASTRSAPITEPQNNDEPEMVSGVTLGLADQADFSNLRHTRVLVSRDTQSS